MNYLPFAILANFLNSLAVTVDKFLLVKSIPDPIIYIFYFSLASFAALILLPLTNIPSVDVFILASASTLFWTAGAYFMFWALKVGHLTRVIPIIGVLTPLILLVITFKSAAISPSETWAIILLLLGLVLLTLPDWKGKFLKKELLLESFSACFYALSYLLLREAFLKQDFLTTLIWSRFILIPLGFIIVLIPPLKSKIFAFVNRKGDLSFKKSYIALFVFGQISAGVSELLLFFAISLANPALVNSLQGSKYVFLLIIGFFLSKKYRAVFGEKYSGLAFASKVVGCIFILLGLYTLSLK